MSDPGHAYRGIAATERTALAWTRSALALAAVGALLIRFGMVEHSEAVGIAAGVPAIAASLWLWAYGDRLYRRRIALVPSSGSHQRVLRGLAALTIALAAVALVLVVVASGLV